MTKKLTPTQRFIRDAIEAAGGIYQLTDELANLGYRGRGETMSTRSVRTWRAGSRIPSSTVIFDLAKRYDIDLSAYTKDEPLASLIALSL